MFTLYIEDSRILEIILFVCIFPKLNLISKKITKRKV